MITTSLVNIHHPHTVINFFSKSGVFFEGDILCKRLHIKGRFLASFENSEDLVRLGQGLSHGRDILALSDNCPLQLLL